MSEVEGFILAGGASSRMGSDKAALALGGETFVRRVARALSGVAGGRVSLVSGRPGADAWGLPVVADVYEKCGALGGLHAALSRARAPLAAVVSCDLPFVTAELFARLVSLARGFDAAAPVQRDGRPQPLCAVYAAAACLPLCEELLRSGERRPRELLRRARTRWVREQELTDLPGAELFFLNVNTPQDYARALAHEDSRGLAERASRF